MLVILSALLILFQFGPSSATLQPPRRGYNHNHCDNTNGNYTKNSIYHQNLISLFGDITSPFPKITNGFYNFSYGYEPDTVHAIAYCRGDVLLDDCRICLKNVTTKLLSSCPNQNVAVGYYDKCVLRYSNQPMYGVMKLKPTYQIIGKFNQVNQSDFSNVLSDLLGSLVSKTVEGNSTLKFAMNKVNVSTSITIYAFTQCSPDLSHSDCRHCLSRTTSYLRVCCQSYRAVRFFRPSCNLRFQTYKFSEAFDTTPTQAPSNENGSTISTSSIIGAVAVAVGATVVCSSLVVVIYLCLRRGRREPESAVDELEDEDGITRLARESLQISYGGVEDRTQGFSEASKLGRS